jgi:RNA polymerase sigma-70 factor (ECF subfamily)
MHGREIGDMGDERALVRRIQQGDGGAFRELVEAHKRTVYYLAIDLCGNHFDAEDLSQEVFIRAYRGIGRFRGGAKLSSWLHRITVNAYIDSQRKKSPKVVSLTDDDGEECDPVDTEPQRVGGDPEQKVSSARITEHIERALEALSEMEKAAFVMRHYHDMPIREISAALGVAEGTVKSLLFRAVRKLRGRLSVYRGELGLEDPV